MITSVIVHQQSYRLSDWKENVEIQFSVSGITFIISSLKDNNFRHCMPTFDNIRDVWRYQRSDQNVIYCSWSECHLLFMIRMSSIVHDQNVIYCSWILIDFGKFITKCHYLLFFANSTIFMYFRYISYGRYKGF
jgi:hypothetical protein